MPFVLSRVSSFCEEAWDTILWLDSDPLFQRWDTQSIMHTQSLTLKISMTATSACILPKKCTDLEAQRLHYSRHEHVRVRRILPLLPLSLEFPCEIKGKYYRIEGSTLHVQQPWAKAFRSGTLDKQRISIAKTLSDLIREFEPTNQISCTPLSHM